MPTFPLSRRSALLACGLLLGGCTLGPDFLPPDPPKAESFLPETTSDFVATNIPGGEAQRLVQGLDIPGQWWGVFQSAPLNTLIEQALRAQRPGELDDEDAVLCRQADDRDDADREVDVVGQAA